MYQKVTIIGNLGNNPEIKTVSSGSSVATFSVATNRKWTNKDGSQGEETAWFRISAWGKLGEVCNQYLSKGRQVYIEGTLRPDSETGGPRVYQRNDGSYGASFEVTANTVKFLGSKSDAGGSGRLEPAGPDVGDGENIPF